MTDPFSDPSTAPNRSGIFPAAFGGTCEGCCTAIAEDDPIGYSDDNEIICEDCYRYGGLLDNL